MRFDAATIALCIAATGCVPVSASGAKPAPDELSHARRWVSEHFVRMPRAGSTGVAGHDLMVPFSFAYDGKPSCELLGEWRFAKSSEKLDKSRTQLTQTYTDPKTGLEVHCRIVRYADYPTVEWTLYLRNTGKSDTPIITDIRPLDIRLKRAGTKEFVLHHFAGSFAGPGDYQPFESVLGPGESKRFAPAGGRPTSAGMPYFNVETGDGGVIAVVGWAGQWSAEFARDTGDGLRVTGGQELTHFRLHPGEEVRAPMSVLQFYSGDWIRAQNVWRRWMIDHNLPRPGGKLPKPMLIMCDGDYYPGMQTTQEGELKTIDAYLDAGIPLTHWWIDAGWYKCNLPDGWVNVGTWQIDEKRFPGGLKAVSDYIHSRGMQLITWFEPERVTPGSEIAIEHPNWVLTAEHAPAGTPLQSTGLFDLGNPEARKWLTDRIDSLITSQGIDLYRQDFNMDPLAYWRAADAPDRQGITEIRHVTGYLAFWDELRRRHPNMLIDTCASGGRRNDLETLRRAVPLLQSDYRFEENGSQGHNYGISFWIPFHGSGVPLSTPYMIRGLMLPCFGVGTDVRQPGSDFALLRRMVDDWRATSMDMYLGDYYPLTPYSLDAKVWMAWQYDRPETGEGMIAAFRRAECAEPTIRLKPLGLDADARYTLTDLDAKAPREVSGKNLVESGLSIAADKPAVARIIVYKKVKGTGK